MSALIAKHFLNEDSVPNACMYCGIHCNNPLSITGTSGYGKNTTFGPGHTGCPYFRKFNLKSAASTSENQPSSNRPFECPIWHNVYCYYFLENHYTQSHAGLLCPFIVSQEEKTKVLSKK